MSTVVLEKSLMTSQSVWNAGVNRCFYLLKPGASMAKYAINALFWSAICFGNRQHAAN